MTVIHASSSPESQVGRGFPPIKGSFPKACRKGNANLPAALVTGSC
jgi:hypothetical protein